MKAPLANNEVQRLAALRCYDVLDTPPESDYDDLTLLAAQICQTPTALVSLIDEKRQWFKSKVGLSVAETPRDYAFCAHAILNSDKVLEVRDALLDPRFADNPLVTTAPHIRFYAGAPLVTRDGSALGTLSVIDYQPRELNEIQKNALRVLSRHVVTLLELRRGVNELKQAEAALRESEERFRDLFENAHDLIQSVRPDGSILYVNRAWRETLGYSEAEIAGLSLRDIIHPSSLNHCMETFQRVMAGDALGRIEAVFRAKDGREVMVDGTSNCRFVEGKSVATRSIFRNVTEVKRIEQLLRDSNKELAALNASLERKVEKRTAKLLQEIKLRRAIDASYQHFVETTHDLVQSVGADGKFTFVNAAWCAVLGWTSEQALQLNFSQLVKPDQLVHCQSLFSELQQGKNFSQVEVTFVAKDGHEVIVEGNLTGIFVDGAFVGTQSFFRDVTQRKRAEAQLKLAANVFAQSTEAFIISDADNKIVMVNQAFTALTGYSEAEALGQNPLTLLSAGHQGEDFERTMGEAVQTHGHWQGEMLDRRKDGSTYPKWMSVSRILDEQGKVTHYIDIFNDISQRKRFEERIERLAHFDALTGLPNRILLNDRISHGLSRAQRNHAQLAVMFLDLDHFKNINDNLGHRIGDLLLIEIAARLKVVVRDEDTVSRLGGDEFILVLSDTDADGAARVAEKLIEAVSQHYQIEQHDLVITPSIGIAMYPGDGEDFESLSKCADVAMYRAKSEGRNGYRFFTTEMQARSARNLQLENALRSALQRGEFYLHYQPQLSLQDSRLVGVEALLRWQHPELGIIAPAEFIPIAEDSGQILKIGEWVLRTATQQLRLWMDKGMAPMIMAVNLSAVQFRHPNLPELITQILDEVQFLPQYLELELTEGVAMDNPLGAIAVMDNLHERGIRMSIDDFGTGYSSLNYLKRFQIYKLKIDQSFVRDITEDPEGRAIVAAIIRMAGALGLKTIAEGVETEGQLAFLRAQGCNEAQGYYFSKPIPPDEFEALVWGKVNSD